jgi:hypothetical protein
MAVTKVVSGKSGKVLEQSRRQPRGGLKRPPPLRERVLYYYELHPANRKLFHDRFGAEKPTLGNLRLRADKPLREYLKDVRESFQVAGAPGEKKVCIPRDTQTRCLKMLGNKEEVGRALVRYYNQENPGETADCEKMFSFYLPDAKFDVKTKTPKRPKELTARPVVASRRRGQSPPRSRPAALGLFVKDDLVDFVNEDNMPDLLSRMQNARPRIYNKISTLSEFKRALKKEEAKDIRELFRIARVKVTLPGIACHEDVVNCERRTKKELVAEASKCLPGVKVKCIEGKKKEELCEAISSPDVEEFGSECILKGRKIRPLGVRAAPRIRKASRATSPPRRTTTKKRKKKSPAKVPRMPAKVPRSPPKVPRSAKPSSMAQKEFETLLRKEIETYEKSGQEIPDKLKRIVERWETLKTPEKKSTSSWM